MRLDLARLPKWLRRRFFLGLAYRQVYATAQGKEVLSDLLAFCGMDKDAFVAGVPDATAYNLGRRRVGLRIAALLGFDEREASKHIDRASTGITQGDEP